MRFGWRKPYESRGSRTVLRGAEVKLPGLLTPKIERTVISYEAKYKNYLLDMFTWVSILVFISLILFIPLSIYIRYTDNTLDDAHIYMILFLAGSAILPIFWLSIRANFGVMFHYRDKNKYQKSLLKITSRKFSLSQKLLITKLFSLRIVTSILPIFLIIYIPLLLLSAIFLGILL